MKLRIAARRSDLARAQAYTVAQRLQKAHPGLEVEFLFKKSLGDINLHDPLWKMPEKGVFTSDLSKDLREGAADIVVHSWKDLPIEENSATFIAATLPREDCRDLLLFKATSVDLLGEKRKLRIFSSSPRRAHNGARFLKNYLPHPGHEIDFVDVRGNIPTRLEKYLAQEDIDGLIVAKAALDRLLEQDHEDYAPVKEVLGRALQQSQWLLLPLYENPPAAAQGALAIEVRRDDEDSLALLAAINCARSFQEASREREILKSFGGGCHQKIGASVQSYAFGTLEIVRGQKPSGEEIEIKSFVSTRKNLPGERLPRTKIFPPTKSASLFARVSQDMEQPKGPARLWVSRANALPEEWTPTKSCFLWTAGLETWRALAKRGWWVSGTSESLGESWRWGEASLGRLFKAANLDLGPWLKISHSQGLASADKSYAATYCLERNDEKVDWASYSIFFWKSSSLFEQALKEDPSLRSRGLHACGPGNTGEKLKEMGLDPLVYPSFELFLKDFAQAPL
jgi:hydroxymethylbilane synthase